MRPQHVTVDHVTTVDLPEHELLAVRLQPPRSVLPKSVRLVMGIQVHAEGPPDENADGPPRAKGPPGERA